MALRQIFLIIWIDFAMNSSAQTDGSCDGFCGGFIVLCLSKEKDRIPFEPGFGTCQLLQDFHLLSAVLSVRAMSKHTQNPSTHQTPVESLSETP